MALGLRAWLPLLALGVGSYLGLRGDLPLPRVPMPSATEASPAVPAHGTSDIVDDPRPPPVEHLNEAARLNPTCDLQRAWLLAEGPHHQPGDGRRLVTFTFDDGPGPRTTPALLRVLRKHKVRGTFFLIGSYLEGTSHRAGHIRDAAKMIVDQGHLVGNHTFRHRRLRDISGSEVLGELDDSGAAIERVTGARPTFFRPPFGDLDPTAQKLVQGHHLELVLWSVEARDMLRGDPEKMTAELKGQLDYSNGGIVLLHDVKWSTVKVLDELLRWLESRAYDETQPSRPGYQIVDLPTYLAATAASPQPYADRDALSRARLEAWKKAHPDEAVAPPPATLTQAAFHGE